MKLEHYVENNICVLSITGDILQDGIEEIKPYLRPFIEDQKIKGLLVNLENVNIINSSGVGLILSVFRSMEKRGASMALCNVRETTAEFLRIVNLHQVLNFYPTEKEALEQM